MLLGQYPYLGETLQDTYDKVWKIEIACLLIPIANLCTLCPVFGDGICLKRLLVAPCQIVNNPLILPDGMNPMLKDLLEGLLCKGLWITISY